MLTRVVFLCLFLLNCELVFAQTNSYVTFYGIEQRTSMYNAEESRHKGIIKKLPTYTPSFGFIFSQNFSSRLGVDYGFCIGRQEQYFEIYATPGASEPSIKGGKKILYLKLPLLLRADLVSSPRNIVFIGGGPQVSVLLSEDGVVPVYAGNTKGVASDTLIVFDFAEAAGAYRQFTFDVAGTMGWRTRLYKNLFLLIQLKVEYSLTDVEDKSYSTLFYGNLIENVYQMYSRERPATHNFAYGAGVGLSYKFR